jgi:hypothetical protein
MDILIANLKQLYQRRGLWAVYACLGLCGVIPAHRSINESAAGKGEFIAGLVIEMVVGWIVAEMQMNVLTKPFSFCLPGHRQVVRQVVFLIAVVTSLAGSLMFLAYPGLPDGHLWVVLCSAFFAGLATCVVTAWLGFRSGRSGSAAWLLLVPLFGSWFFDLHILLERAIVDYPLQVIGVGSLVALVVWISLGDGDFARD